MKKFRFLSAAVAGTFFYVLISLFCGRDGVFAERQQLEQKRILSIRTEKIQKINNSLQLERTALENDKEVIGGLAKKLGFISNGDKIVVINGLGFADEVISDPGTPVKASAPEYLPEWISKACGLLVFCSLSLYILVEDMKNRMMRKRTDKVYVEGIAVYDLPQI